jgi:hypothetical protein
MFIEELYYESFSYYSNQSDCIFACGLLTACFAWHNISVYITYLFSINELCARPNLPPQHLLHVSLEPPKSPLKSIAGYKCEPPIRHQALPACGGDLVGSTSGSRACGFLSSRTTCYDCRCRPVGRLARRCCVLRGFCCVTWTCRSPMCTI